MQHALARRKSIHFSEALAHGFVAPHAESSLWTLMKQAAEAAGQTLESRIQVSSFECMCRLVEVGLGIALLPELVLAPYAESKRMKLVHLKDDWAQRDIVIVARDMAHLPLTTRALVEHLRSAGTGA